MERRIEEKKEEIEKLYILDDTFGLEDEEINRRQELMGDVMLESSWNESQLLQKPKLKWLQQGDANSSFFHNWVKSRHKRNEIVGLWNNGTWVESVQGVKQLAHYHFKRQFEAVEENSAYFSETLFRNHVGLTNNEYGGLEWLNNVNNLSGGSRSGSGWWKDISNLYWGKRGEEGWKADFYKEVGEGENTFFGKIVGLIGSVSRLSLTDYIS
ncbi:hypothetical protein ACS0TY_020678 [Phlomoides rotata]